MVKRDGLVDKLIVTADGTGQVGHAGSALLAGSADRFGLTRALSAAMAPSRQRRSAHDPGVVLRDLAVMLADGGNCLADLGAQRDQPDLFGDVASDSTAFRVIDSIDEECLGGCARRSRSPERGRGSSGRVRSARGAWQNPSERTVIDVDATFTSATPRRNTRPGQLQGRLRPSPAAVLPRRHRRGAGRRPAARQRRLEHRRRPQRRAGSRARAARSAALEGEILVRADGAGASHELTHLLPRGACASRSASTLRARPRRDHRPARERCGQAIRADGSSASTPRSPRSPTASTSPPGPRGRG